MEKYLCVGGCVDTGEVLEVATGPAAGGLQGRDAKLEGGQ